MQKQAFSCSYYYVEAVHVPVGALGVEPVALAGPRTPRPASALLGLGLRDGRDEELIHAGLGVVDVLLDETRVDDVVDAVDGQRRLGNIGGNDYL